MYMKKIQTDLFNEVDYGPINEKFWNWTIINFENKLNVFVMTDFLLCIVLFNFTFYVFAINKFPW